MGSYDIFHGCSLLHCSVFYVAADAKLKTGPSKDVEEMVPNSMECYHMIKHLDVTQEEEGLIVRVDTICKQSHHINSTVFSIYHSSLLM